MLSRLKKPKRLSILNAESDEWIHMTKGAVEVSSPMAAARSRVNSSKHSCNFSSVYVVLCVTVGLMMAMGFLLYLSIAMTPGLLRTILQDVNQCRDQFGRPVSNSVLSPKLSKIPNYNTMNMDESASDSRLSTQLIRDGRSITIHCCSCEPDENAHPNNTQLHQNIADDSVQLGVRQRIADAGEPKFRILLGVLTMAEKVDRRNILRLAYSVQSSRDANVTVRFVMGTFSEGSKMVDRTLVAMENATFGDIIVLNCSENLNEGKTFVYFSSLPALGVEYDYVMKTDDDSYIRFDNLGRSLKNLSRTDLYYGYILPCDNDDPYAWYMAGMGYLISWDLVLWIRDSPIARNKSVGTEDQLVGDWFNEGGVAKHRVNKKPLFYDHPEFGGECAHELVPETILLHQVKTVERWAHVLDFFEKDRISQALSIP